MRKYTISAILNGGESSIDYTAETREEAKTMLDKAKSMIEKMDRCGDLKQGEVVEYMIDEWTCYDDGELIDLVDNVYYERVDY